jgi:hypothetical protein
MESKERDIMTRFLFEFNENDSELTIAAKIELKERFFNGEFEKEDLLLFADSFILPLDFRYQLLNQNDLNFMLENNLTEDEMKKIKSLSIFLKKELVEGDD